MSETPVSGNQFLGFSGGLSGTSPTQSLTMDAPAAAAANFSAITSGSGWFTAKTVRAGRSRLLDQPEDDHGEWGASGNVEPCELLGGSLRDGPGSGLGQQWWVRRPVGWHYILLFTVSDGSTKLNHEIETYNAATGQLIAWIQAPFLEPNVNTVIYMCITETRFCVYSQANPTGTWDSNFQGVWHLPGVVTLNTADTVRRNHRQPLWRCRHHWENRRRKVNVGGRLKFLRYSG